MERRAYDYLYPGDKLKHRECALIYKQSLLQDQLQNLWHLVHNKDGGLLVKKLRILRWQHQSIKPSIGQTSMKLVLVLHAGNTVGFELLCLACSFQRRKKTSNISENFFLEMKIYYMMANCQLLGRYWKSILWLLHLQF